MRLYDETTTQSGASRATSPDTSPGDLEISTGTPEALACAVTSSSPSRTSAITWKEAIRLSSAARVVGPKPIRSTRGRGALELIEELQVERGPVGGRFQQDRADLEATGLQPDHRFGPRLAGEDRHVACGRRLDGPEPESRVAQRRSIE